SLKRRGASAIRWLPDLLIYLVPSLRPLSASCDSSPSSFVMRASGLHFGFITSDEQAGDWHETDDKHAGPCHHVLHFRTRYRLMPHFARFGYSQRPSHRFDGYLRHGQNFKHIAKTPQSHGNAREKTGGRL